jgi:hypothetical protein
MSLGEGIMKDSDDPREAGREAYRQGKNRYSESDHLSNEDDYEFGKGWQEEEEEAYRNWQMEHENDM